MHTLTIDILNTHAEKLLEDLERLQLIRVRKERNQTPSVINWAGTYKDSLINQSTVNGKKELNEPGWEQNGYSI